MYGLNVVFFRSPLIIAMSGSMSPSLTPFPCLMLNSFATSLKIDLNIASKLWLLKSIFYFVTAVFSTLTDLILGKNTMSDLTENMVKLMLVFMFIIN